jgi:hypothetical protein
MCKKALNERVLLETRLIKMIRMKPSTQRSYTFNQENKEISDNQNRKSLKEDKETQEKIKDENKKIETTETPVKAEEISKEENKEDLGSEDLKYVLDNWDGILNDIKKIRISFHAVIKEAEPTELNKNTLKLAFQPNYKFHYDTANKKENLDFFKAFINKKLNRDYDIEFFFDDGKKKVEIEEESEDIFQKAESFFGQKIEKIKD